MNVRLVQTALFSLLILGWVAPAVSAAAVEAGIPANDGFVTDAAGVLETSDEAALEQQLREYQRSTSNEIAVVILPALSGAVLEDRAVEIGRAWGVGTTKDNGILILVALQERAVTIQTGYGLEGAVPDIVAKGVIEEEIVPAFREGHYYEGLVAAVDALEKHIGGEYTAERYETFQGGGMWPFLLFVGFIVIDAFAAFLGRSKSWWLGGVMGGGLGLALVLLFGWWVSIPIFIVIGLVFDYVVSRIKPQRKFRRGGWWGGGGFGGRGGGGGGFGGFGGGSFGGGGASGKW